VALPVFQTDIRELSQMQTNWTSQLNPVLSSPTLAPSLLKGIKIVPGVNVINHKLGKTQQGWYVADIDAVITLYRSAPLNDLTLALTSNGNAIITLAVF